MRYRLGDVAAKIIDGDRGKNYPNEFTENGYCLFLSAKNVTSTGFSFKDKQDSTAKSRRSKSPHQEAMIFLLGNS